MRFWKFIKDDLKNIQEERFQEHDQANQQQEEQTESQLHEIEQPTEGPSNDIEQPVDTQPQEKEQSTEEPGNDIEQQADTQPQEGEQSTEVPGNNIEQQAEIQPQEGEQSTEELSNNIEQQVDAQPQESEQSTEELGNDIEQQADAQPQEGKQSTEEPSNNIEQQVDAQPQESEQSTEEPSNNVEQQDEVQPQEKEQPTEESSENDTLEEKKEKIQQLRDKLVEYARKKKEQEELEKQKLDKSQLNRENDETVESKEEEYQLSEHTNKFLEQLQELPSFKDRDRAPGYAIDTDGDTELPDSMIRTLITKFLNQRFCRHNTDLNVRSTSLEKARGFYKWEVKDVVTHLQTHQITKVLDDKYGYEYANGKNENVPLSFYFDMSGSMSEYTNMLAVIAIELLKKGVKVLIGFNERVNVQFESINRNIDVKELADILESAGYSSWGFRASKDSLKKDSRVSFKFIDKNIDNYLLSKKAEKCVVFSDFDPLMEVINLSHNVDVYWFCFEQDFSRSDLDEFNGFIYKVRNAKDIAEGLIKVNENRFEVLCYLDKSKVLQKK